MNLEKLGLWLDKRSFTAFSNIDTLLWNDEKNFIFFQKILWKKCSKFHHKQYPLKKSLNILVLCKEQMEICFNDNQTLLTIILFYYNSYYKYQFPNFFYMIFDSVISSLDKIYCRWFQFLILLWWFVQTQCIFQSRATQLYQPHFGCSVRRSIRPSITKSFLSPF